MYVICSNDDVPVARNKITATEAQETLERISKY